MKRKEVIDKVAVGNRLKEFALKEFGTIKVLADKIEMGYGGFHGTYIKGKSVPGSELLVKLDKLGCDIHWLLTGETTAEMIVKIRTERDVYKKKYEEEVDKRKIAEAKLISYERIIKQIEKINKDSK